MGREKSGGLAREIQQLKLELEKQSRKRGKLVRTLHNLNLQYEYGLLSYSEYSALFDAYLGHQSAEEWQDHYNEKLAKIKSNLSKVELELRRIQQASSARTLTALSAFAAIVLFASIAGFAIQSNLALTIGQLTGAVIFNETAPIPANATVEIFFAVAPSANLTDGIGFGVVQPGTFNNNATDNYATNGTDTALFIAVSPDSNVNVDFCLVANADLSDVFGNKIEISNLTFANATINNLTVPAQSNAVAVDTAYQDSSQSVAPGSSDFYRFWLDVPSSTPPGAYNNTIIFTAVQEGPSCP